MFQRSSSYTGGCFHPVDTQTSYACHTAITLTHVVCVLRGLRAGRRLRVKHVVAAFRDFQGKCTRGMIYEEWDMYGMYVK